MAFQNNLIPFQVDFYPTTVGATTLLNGGISKFISGGTGFLGFTPSG